MTQPDTTGTADRLVRQINRKIARLQGDLVHLEANRADLTIELLTSPTNPELLARLANTEKAITDYTNELNRNASALVVARSRDAVADKVAAKAASEALAAEARTVIAQLSAGAARIDKHASSLAADLANQKELQSQLAGIMARMGIRGFVRDDLMSLSAAGDVIADRLVRAKVYQQLHPLAVIDRTFAQGRSFAEINAQSMDRVELLLANASA